MTVKEALLQGAELLKQKNSETPYLDATVLLQETLGLSKEKVFASYPDEIGEQTLELFKHFIQRRASGYPVSYLRHKKEFYGLEFYVDERVLVPRPDTETLVEEARAIIQNNPGIHRIHDLCTGSGCIALSLKYFHSTLDISASDISSEAGDVFSYNTIHILGTVLPFYESDLLENVPGEFDMIVSNPPYLRENEVRVMMESGWPEPEQALNGGDRGLDIYERLVPQAVAQLRKEGYLVCEAASEQMPILKAMMVGNGFEEITVINDLGNRPRVIRGRKKW